MAELERRISSLAGSTNKSDIAERRKLEAELLAARESLNDTYYDHAKSSQDDALTAEQTAYEETMTKFVEGMRTSLETATQDMDTFLGKVTTMVSLNAGAILEQYKQTELPLDDALTNPWEAAQKAVGDYDGDALALMDAWAQNGFLTTFSETVKGSLASPWEAGQAAVDAFKSSVDTKMKNVVSAIETNVKTASSKLSALYQQIEDTAKRAAEVGGGSGGSGSGGGDDEIKLRGLMQTSKEMILGPKSFVDKNTETINGIKYYKDSETDYYYKISDLNSKRKYDGGRSTGWAIPKGTWFYTKHAKGTVRTTRDEWAITDEPQFGDELVLVPGKDGNLSFMRKGTGVVPADLTANLMEWGQFTPDSLNLGGGVNVNMINNSTIKPQYDFNFDSLVHVDHCDQSTIKDLEKMVDNKINDFSKQMNYSLKKFAR